MLDIALNANGKGQFDFHIVQIVIIAEYFSRFSYNSMRSSMLQ